MDTVTPGYHCCCDGTEEGLLVQKIEIERATFVRYSQVIQAFGGTATAGAPSAEALTCRDSRAVLLAELLEWKVANFNRLQEVLLAA